MLTENRIAYRNNLRQRLINSLPQLLYSRISAPLSSFRIQSLNPKFSEWYPKTRTRQKGSTWIRVACNYRDSDPLPLEPRHRRRIRRMTQERRSANRTLLLSLGRAGLSLSMTNSLKPCSCKNLRTFFFFPFF